MIVHVNRSVCRCVDKSIHLGKMSLHPEGRHAVVIHKETLVWFVTVIYLCCSRHNNEVPCGFNLWILLLNDAAQRFLRDGLLHNPLVATDNLQWPYVCEHNSSTDRCEWGMWCSVSDAGTGSILVRLLLQLQTSFFISDLHAGCMPDSLSSVPLPPPLSLLSTPSFHFHSPLSMFLFLTCPLMQTHFHSSLSLPLWFSQSGTVISPVCPPSPKKRKKSRRQG